MGFGLRVDVFGRYYIDLHRWFHRFYVATMYSSIFHVVHVNHRAHWALDQWFGTGYGQKVVPVPQMFRLKTFDESVIQLFQICNKLITNLL